MGEGSGGQHTGIVAVKAGRLIIPTDEQGRVWVYYTRESQRTVPVWRLTLKRRVAVVTVFLALWVAGIEARLVFLQVVSHNHLAALAERQHNRTQESPAKRGDIPTIAGESLKAPKPGQVVLWLEPGVGDVAPVVPNAEAADMLRRLGYAH